MTKLSTEAIEETLWETINKIKTGKMKPAEANAISMSAKEILNSVRLKMQYVVLSGEHLRDHKIPLFERSMKRNPKKDLVIEHSSIKSKT